jgi:hypothetical protein
VSTILDNLVSFWPLDEVSGRRADVHGTNALTDNNSVASATGKVGLAADFEGDNSESLSVADNTSLSMGVSQDFAIALWVYRESSSGFQVLLSKSETDIEYAIFDTGVFSLEVYGSAGFGDVGTLTSTIPLSLNTWYFLVVWHDAAANTLNLSVNGSAPESIGHSAGVYDGAGTFRLGSYVYGSHFDGLLDQVGIWKRLLTADEITWLYNSGAGRTYMEMRVYAIAQKVWSDDKLRLELARDRFDGPAVSIDDGVTWDVTGGGDAVRDGSGNLTFTGGAVVVYAERIDIDPGPDQWVEFNTTTLNNYPGVMLRNGGGTFYWVYRSATDIGIDKTLAGVFAGRKTLSGFAPNVADTVRVHVEDTDTISVYVNDVLRTVLHNSDLTEVTGYVAGDLLDGSIGIASYNAGAAPITNWRGGSLVTNTRTLNTYAVDLFERSTGLGADWVESVGGFQSIIDQWITGDATPDDSFAYWVGSSMGVDHASRVVLTNGSIGNVTPAVRMTAGGDAYFAQTAPGFIYITKRVSGVHTIIETIAQSIPSDSTLLFTASGTNLRFYVNGVKVGPTISDSSIATGKPGIYSFRDVSYISQWEGWDGVLDIDYAPRTAQIAEAVWEYSSRTLTSVTLIVRPDATSVSGDWTAVGGATLHESVNDESDSTYVLSGTGASSPSLELLEGASTVRATRALSPTGSIAEVYFDLTTPERDSVTDWSDVRVRITDGGTPVTFQFPPMQTPSGVVTIRLRIRTN